MPFSQSLVKVSSLTATRSAGKSLLSSILILLIDIIRSPVDFGKGVRVQVDLDAEKGQQSRGGRDNKHSVRIEKARNDRIYLSVVRDYLDGKCDFNNGILEAISE